MFRKFKDIIYIIIFILFAFFVIKSYFLKPGLVSDVASEANKELNIKE